MAESRSGIDAQPLLAGEELPGPVDRFALEVVAEAEVAQHLEEGVVVGGAADVVDVAGAEAFLAGGGAGELQLAAAEEVVLELVHAGGREEHRGVPAGHEHVAGPADAAFGLEEGQVLFAQFVAFHGHPYGKLEVIVVDIVKSCILSDDGGGERAPLEFRLSLALSSAQSPPLPTNASRRCPNGARAELQRRVLHRLRDCGKWCKTPVRFVRSCRDASCGDSS